MLLPLVLVAHAAETVGLAIGKTRQSPVLLYPPDDGESEDLEHLIADSGHGTGHRPKPNYTYPKDPVYNHSKAGGKPMINFNLNTYPHFEVLVALIHMFQGHDLPYRSKLSPYVESILKAAKQHGSECFVNSQYTTHHPDRKRILTENMGDHNVTIGWHAKPDLTVMITVYSTLQTFQNMALQHWKDKDEVLLVVHNFTHNFSHSDLASFASTTKHSLREVGKRGFTNFENWKNAVGLMPNLKSYVLPTYVPFRPHSDSRSVPPTFCVQGGLSRRDFVQFGAALNMMGPSCNFKIALAGHGHTPSPILMFADRTRHFPHLDDVAFGDFFQECDYLLPLLSDKTLPEYLTTKLSSTVTRSIGFNVPIIAWDPFQKLYPMLKGKFYSDTAGFKDAMERACWCQPLGDRAP